jgi:hypothetical protein
MCGSIDKLLVKVAQCFLLSFFLTQKVHAKDSFVHMIKHCKMFGKGSQSELGSPLDDHLARQSIHAGLSEKCRNALYSWRYLPRICK